MKREIGKVPTNINKDRVAGGSVDKKPKEDWGEYAKRLNMSKVNKSPNSNASTKEQKNISTIKQIINDRQPGKDR